MAIGPQWPDPAKKIFQFPHGRAPTLPSAKPSVQPDKVCVADLRAEAIRGLVASTGIGAHSSDTGNRRFVEKCVVGPRQDSNLQPSGYEPRVIEFPPTSGRCRPCRDDGGGEIALGFTMLQESNRASHIDPPASSYAIMRRISPTAERTLDLARMFEGELDRKPGIREQPGLNSGGTTASRISPLLPHEPTLSKRGGPRLMRAFRERWR